MNSIFGPALIILVKWTVLLALGWTAHGLLRKRHSRWRLILWRSILCFGLVVPLMHFTPLPILRIPIYRTFVFPTEAEILPLATTGSPIPRDKTNLQSPPVPFEANTVSKSFNPPPPRTASNAIPWGSLLVTIWGLGAVFAGLRLIRLQVQLNRLRKESSMASPVLHGLVREIQSNLGVQRTIDTRISDAVSSPFACGLLKPMIMLPQKLVQDLPPDEIAALLTHEMAHFHRHDLVWCVGWRWIQAIFWFHPLVWKIPAAHKLACEQEADRIASSQLQDRGFYPQLLARLTLRVLSMPEVETQLVLNGTSQITQRLNHLKQGKVGTWTWRHSAAGFGLVAVLFLTAIGCEFSKAKRAETNTPAIVEFKKVSVLVQDEDGIPLEGATITPFGFRVQGVRRVDGYGWLTNRFGPPNPVVADHEGRAWLTYPVVAIPEEKLLTGELTFTVSHPDYCPVVCQGFQVDGTGKAFRLIKGIPLEVSAYYSKGREPVTELVPSLSQEGIKPQDWQIERNGIYVYRQLSAGRHLIQLMGRLPSGQIVYSDAQEFTAEKGKPCHFEMEMRQGIRIEGRLDDSVRRPVIMGRVLINVRPQQIRPWLIPEDVGVLSKTYGGRFRFWHTYRPIAEDGTFVFESVPPGEVDIIVWGVGFVSKSIGKVQNRMPNGTLANGPVIGIPQAFPLSAPLTKIELVTEPTATLELTTKTRWGEPIEGATVHLNPNVLRMGGIFGWMRDSSEAPFRALPELPNVPYSGKTDKNGKVEIRNLPAVARGLEIQHPTFVVALADKKGLPNRRIRATFMPGMTNVMAVTLEPGGKDFIGTAR